MTVAAVMPLPEGMSELAFAGALGGARMPMIRRQGNCRSTPRPTSASPARGPHPDCSPKVPSATTWATTAWRTSFPLLRVDTGLPPRGSHLAVHGRRPPAAGRHRVRRADPRTDRPVIPTVIPGVHAVHAVDAAGVHPLLLAIGSERYVPYETRAPAARTADPGQRDARPGADVAGQVPLDRRRQDDPTCDVRRCGPSSSGTCWSGSTGDATCTFRPARPSTRSTTPAQA